MLPQEDNEFEFNDQLIDTTKIDASSIGFENWYHQLPNLPTKTVPSARLEEILFYWSLDCRFSHSARNYSRVSLDNHLRTPFSLFLQNISRLLFIHESLKSKVHPLIAFQTIIFFEELLGYGRVTSFLKNLALISSWLFTLIKVFSALTVKDENCQDQT